MRLRPEGLGDLVHVVPAGQPRAQVEELLQALHLGEVTHRAVEEAPVLPGDVQAFGEHLADGAGGLVLQRQVVAVLVQRAEP